MSDSGIPITVVCKSLVSKSAVPAVVNSKLTNSNHHKRHHLNFDWSSSDFQVLFTDANTLFMADVNIVHESWLLSGC